MSASCNLHWNSSPQSDYVTAGLQLPPSGAFPTLATAQASRDTLMTVLLISGAGRPDHVTGIDVQDVETARVSIHSWTLPSVLVISLTPNVYCRAEF